MHNNRHRPETCIALAVLLNLTSFLVALLGKPWEEDTGQGASVTSVLSVPPPVKGPAAADFQRPRAPKASHSAAGAAPAVCAAAFGAALAFALAARAF